LLIAARGLEVLVEADGEVLQLPEASELAPMVGPHIYLGQLGERPCFAAPLRADVQLPAKLRLVAARLLAPSLEPAQMTMLGQAIALTEWDSMHRYCGRCAVPTTLLTNERARRCPECKFVFYPRISPAVIVLVERNNKVLLARNVNFPVGRYSILAGFLETGESLEQAAVREIREEVGIEISDLRYFDSQPWPFGRSLMIGFYAQYASGEIRVDGNEIAEADWFALDRLPELPPRISIARRMIDRFVASKMTAPR
jgi:NAD+ diphosphatase